MWFKSFLKHVIILHAYRIVSLLWIITPHRDQKAFAVQLLPKIFPFTLFFPPCLKWDLYGNFFFCRVVMQNHLLKGMEMLDGIKKTQPGFQLSVKGIFKISRGFTQPLAAQPHQHQTKSKWHCGGAEFHPPPDLSRVWMRLRSNGESRVGPSCRGERGCARGVPRGQPRVAPKRTRGAPAGCV